MEFLSLAFMQRALIAALLSGLSSPAIGTYIVQRRLSLLGDGLGHVAIAGVGLALVTGLAPLPVAVAVCIAGAVGIEFLRQNGRATGDMGLAMLFYGGLALGVLLSSIAGQGAAGLTGYLFGSLSTVTSTDVAIVAVLAFVVIVLGVGLSPQLFAVCSDEDFARVLGLPVRFYNFLIVALAAITVTTAMRTVGLLLVSALMVIPVAAAQNLFRGFTAGLFGSMAIGGVVAVSGLIGSYYFNTAPGALIVVLAIVVFALSWPVATLLHRKRTRTVDDTDPTPIPHEVAAPHPDHVHGPDCGHPVIEHGDHVDYVHAGHRHAVHGDHYDEH